MNEECFLCSIKYNRGMRKEVRCPYCQYPACRACWERYLLESVKDPHCMNCNKGWVREILDQLFTQTWVNRDLKKHREKILFDREKALMPETMAIVEKMVRTKSLKDEIADLQEMIKDLREEIRMINGKQTVERKKFVRACPKVECKGFLSTQWRCGLCETWVCSECHVIKKKKNDTEHKCKEDDVKTAELLRKEVKMCPKCGEGIFKISGCFSPYTEILMWDGTIKKACDIRVGDHLIGDDGKKRTVLELVTGVDTMFTVKQNKGEDYTVNSKHTLVLKFNGHKHIGWYSTINAWKLRWFDQKPRSKLIKATSSREDALVELKKYREELCLPNSIEILVENFVKLPEKTQRRFYGYKSSGVKWEYQKVSLDPYLLGMWLGDGYSNGKEFCSNDSRLIEYWKEWASKNDAEVVKTTNKFRYYVRRRKGSSNRSNPLKDKLSMYNLVNNKHIPREYLINDRETRLKLLAGLIDTDGCVQNKGCRIVITQVNVPLSESIQFLAQSLGFSVSKTIRKKKQVVCPNTEPKDYQDQQYINISGDRLDHIPTLLPRKKCSRQSGGVDLLRTSIQVIRKKNSTYYGWRVDNNKRFLLRDFTVSRNCSQMWCTSCRTAFDWVTGKIVFGQIHNPHFYEWQRSRNKGEAPRVQGDLPCGGIPEYYDVVDHLKAIRLSRKYRNEFGKIHRIATHIQDFELNNVQDEGYRNERMRVKYLMNELNEKMFKKKIQMMEKARSKNLEVNQVLETYSRVTGDLFRNLLGCNERGEALDILDECRELRDYVNNQFEKIRKRYKNVIPYITEEYDIIHI